MNETIYQILCAEHNKAKATLEYLASSSMDDAPMRRDKGIDVAIDLISHNEAESKILFQRLMDFAELRYDVEEHLEGHADANERLRELLDIDVEGPEWLAYIDELKDVIEQEIEEEEEYLFPEIQYYLTENEARELGSLYLEEQSRRRGFLSAA